MSKAIRLFNSKNEPVYPCPYFPIGYIYFSADSTNPGTIFGGNWERIKDKFILCAGDSYSAGSTGGSSSHYHSTGDCTLTESQIPSHQHYINNYNTGGYSTDTSYTVTAQPNKGYNANLMTRAAGGNKAHNHGNTGKTSSMPPYLAVYVWKRVS